VRLIRHFPTPQYLTRRLMLRLQPDRFLQVLDGFAGPALVDQHQRPRGPGRVPTAAWRRVRVRSRTLVGIGRTNQRPPPTVRDLIFLITVAAATAARDPMPTSRASDIDRHLPLKPVVFQILLSLADGEHHGYGITQEIAARTSARIDLEPGNLYRSLKTMLDDGLIEESDRRPAPDLDGASPSPS